MRINDFSGGNNELVLEYPELNIFVNDNNYVRLYSDISASVEITSLIVQNTNTGEISDELSYISPFGNLVLNLSDVFKSLYIPNNNDTLKVSLTCTYTIAGYKHAYYNFWFYVYLFNGTSFQDRTHGSRYLYVYDNDDFSQLDFYFPYSGKLRFNGSNAGTTSGGVTTLNLSGFTINNGVNILHFSNENTKPLLSIDTFSPIHTNDFTTIMSYEERDGLLSFLYIGDVFNGRKDKAYEYDVIIEVVDNCSENDFLIRYVDTDGCRRKLMGKVKSQKEDAKQTAINGEFNVYSNTVSAFKDSNTKEVTVTFPNISSLAYIQDLLYADKIEYQNINGEWVECMLKTNSIKSTEEKFDDYELSFLINSK